MKKMLLTAMLIVACTAAFAQEKQAQIKFNKTTLDLGKFSEAQPVQECIFTFTNAGTGHQSSRGLVRMHRARLYQRARGSR